MKAIIVLLAVSLLAGCQNMNVAWRGQVTVYSTNNHADTDGKVVNAPKFREGSKSIMAPKEYTDSFNPNTKVNSEDGIEVPSKKTLPKNNTIEGDDHKSSDPLEVEPLDQSQLPPIK